MWRRVASQSPLSIPTNADQPDAYLTAWAALGKMLANGRSLSGREKNCCLLNHHGGFTDVSAVAGIDFPDDSRGVGITDWDGDGDLDAWVSNRTAPRVRFLKNTYASAHHFLAVKLQGRLGNRDAIGARVEVIRREASRAGEARLVRSLRAGQGYLGQSSKWLHFGLGESNTPVSVAVIWPNGTQEVFPDLEVDRRYVIEENNPSVRAVEKRFNISLAASTPKPPTSPAQTRIVVPARFPLPGLSYESLAGQRIDVESTGGPYLINLWATWCMPCLQELSEWTRRQDELQAEGVKVLLLSVDNATGKEHSITSDTLSATARQLGLPFTVGMATDETLQALDTAQQVLTKRVRQLPVPTTFLVDREGRLAVVYKGGVAITRLLEDLKDLDRPTPEQRDLAVPFPGRWYTNPFPPDLLSVAGEFKDRNQPELALDYLTDHFDQLILSESGTSRSGADVANMLVGLGIIFQQRGDRARVVSALRSAAELEPANLKTRMALTMVHQEAGEDEQAVEQYRAMLKVKPNDPVLSNNLAWLLATTDNPSVRNAKEAIQLAETVCKESRRQFAPALDTLAAAYAASGDFGQAATIIQEAIALQRKQGATDRVPKLEARLRAYQQGIEP